MWPYTRTPSISFTSLVKKRGDVLVRGPVHRHAQLVAVLLLEALLQLRRAEPVLPEPVQVGELLVGQLVHLPVRRRDEALAHEVVDVQRGQRHVLALARHEVRQRHHEAVAQVRADQVAVVHVHVVDALARLHLRLQLLDDVAFLDQVVLDLDASDLLEGLGQRLRLVDVGVDRLGHDVDRLPAVRLGRVAEPLQLRRAAARA